MSFENYIRKLIYNIFMKKRIPFVPFSMEKAKLIARHYTGWGERLSKFFPSLKTNLQQAEYDIEPREWTAIAFYFSITYAIYLFAFIFFLAVFIIRLPLLNAITTSIPIGLIFGAATFFYIGVYPKLYVTRKIKDLERNMPYALHHLLIQVRSGVTLFNSIVSIARSNYGWLSEEFSRAVKEINTGASEIGALEMLARENPSLYFRRILWQVINALKSGADIGDTIKEIVDNLTQEQRVAIRKYGSELNPLALFYMVLVVIFPTLGIIFLLILFSFVGTVFSIEFVLVGILVFLVIVQFMFMGIIKTKRPFGV